MSGVCFVRSGFPLVSRLSSTPSAARGAPLPLFGRFPGITQLSDFLEPFIDDLPFWGSRRGPSGHLRAAGSRISRFPYERLERAHGVFDHAGPEQLAVSVALMLPLAPVDSGGVPFSM